MLEKRPIKSKNNKIHKIIDIGRSICYHYQMLLAHVFTHSYRYYRTLNAPEYIEEKIKRTLELLYEDRQHEFKE